MNISCFLILRSINMNVTFWLIIDCHLRRINFRLILISHLFILIFIPFPKFRSIFLFNLLINLCFCFLLLLAHWSRSSNFNIVSMCVILFLAWQHCWLTFLQELFWFVVFLIVFYCFLLEIFCIWFYWAIVFEHSTKSIIINL